MFFNRSVKIAKKYFQRAFNSEMKGNHTEAHDYYSTSIEIHPTAQAYINLGSTYAKEENFEAAIKLCHKALTLDLNCSAAYSDIGYYLLQLRKVNEAIIWLEEAILLNDFDGKFYTYYNLGKAYEKNGFWQRGIEMYNKSISQKPGFKLGKEKLLALSSKLN